MTKIEVAIAPDTEINVEQFLKKCGVKDYKNLKYYFPILIDTILGDRITLTLNNKLLVTTMLGAEGVKG